MGGASAVVVRMMTRTEVPAMELGLCALFQSSVGDEAAAGGDAALLVRYAGGDRAAFARLLERHWEHAFRIARRVLGDPALAEDCAQEAFARMAVGAARYRAEGAFEGYLYRVVVNAARSLAKGRRRREARERRAGEARAAAVAAGGGRSDGPGPEELLEHLARLPFELATALRLRYLEELTHEEVAAALDVAPGTASSRIRRGLEKLRESLARAGYGTAAPGALVARLGGLAARDVVARTPAPARPSVEAIESLGRTLARAALRMTAAKAAAALLFAVAAVASIARGGGRLRAPGAAGERAAEAVSPGGAQAAAARGGRALSPAAGGAVGEAEKNAVAARAGSGDAAPDAGPGVAPAGAPRIAGVVFGPDGAPFAGAEVALLHGREPLLHATSGADGGFILAPVPEALAREIVTIAARDPGRHLLPGLALARASDPEAVRIHLARGAAIEGTVLDAATGAPISGASLTAEPEGVLIPSTLEIPGESATDADGAFRIAPLRPHAYRVVVRAPGYAPSRSDAARAEAGAVVRMSIELGRGGRIMGRVVGPEGEPLPGACVAAYIGRSRPALIPPEDWLEAHASGLAFEWASGKTIEPERTPSERERDGVLGADALYARAGADGRYTLGGLPAGKWRVIAVHPEFRTASERVVVTDGADAPADFALAPGSTIFGFVRGEGGRPLAGAVVIAEALSGHTSRQVMADEVGAYRIAGLSPGDYAVTAVPFDDREQPVEEAPGSGIPGVRLLGVGARDALRFDLGPAPGGATLCGRVHRAGRAEPLAGLLLRAVDRAGAPGLGSLSDSDGAFSFEGLAPGRYRLEVGGFLHCVERTVAVEIAPDGADVVRDVDLASAGVAGTVRAAETGAPLGAAIVVAEPAGPGGAMQASFSWPDGTFAIDGLAPGEYVVRAAAAGWTDAATRPLAIVEGARLGGVDLALASGGALEVLVLDRDGDPLAGASVAIAPDGRSALLLGSIAAPLTDSDGRAVLRGVAPGRYRVHARAAAGEVGASDPFDYPLEGPVCVRVR